LLPELHSSTDSATAADAPLGFDLANPRAATGYMRELYEDVPEISPDPPTKGYLAAAGLQSSVSDLAKVGQPAVSDWPGGAIPVTGAQRQIVERDASNCLRRI
jgi:hypothetical protein